MATVDYDAARAEMERATDPLRFILCGHTFTTVAAPRLGDTFELMDAPEPVGDTEEEAVRALSRFIRRSLIEVDRPKWDEVLYQLGPEHGPLIIRIGTDLAEQYLARPTEPPSESSSGRSSGGRTSKRTGSPEPAGP
jgi:hypothetical protein